MKLTKTEQLQELFEEWKAEQISRGEKIHKFFSKDGIIKEEKYEKTKPKILFILKEPNVLKDLDKEKYNDDNQLQFYKDFFDSTFFEENHKKELKMTKRTKKTNGKKAHYYYFFDNAPAKQKEKIARIAEYIINKNITENYEALKLALEQVAVMNLNKSGGDSDSDKQYFLDYCNDEKFSQYICKEIEIINPDIIILIGAKSYRTQIKQDCINKILNQKTVMELVHTSARGKGLNLSKNEKEKLKNIFGDNYDEDYNKMYQNIVQTDFSKLHLKYDRGVCKYLLKFIAAFES